MEQPILKVLGCFIENLTFDKLPEYVVQKANAAFFDLVGCYYGALGMTCDRSIVNDALLRAYVQESTIWGTGMKTAAEEAALVGGFYGYSLEFDDGVSLGGHWGSASIPAICAVAEKLGKSGKDVITAIVCAYEVGTRISRIYASTLLKNKIHFPCTMGFYAAAAGVAKLMDLPAHTIAYGLANGCLAPIGPYSTALSGESIKNMYSGWPNYIAIRMMQYANAGLGGDTDIFESSDGLGVVFSGHPLTMEQKRESLANLGEKYMIMDSYFKPYPCCRWLHAPLALFQSVLRNSAGRQVESIEILGPNFLRIYDTKGDYSKKTKSQYSIPYTMAAMNIRGKCTVMEFEEPFRTSQVIADFSPRIKFTEDPQLNEQFPKKFNVKVKVKFSNGDVEECSGGLPWGPQAPATKDELKNKFRDLTTNVMDVRDIEAWESVFEKGINEDRVWEEVLGLLSHKIIQK